MSDIPFLYAACAEDIDPDVPLIVAAGDETRLRVYRSLGVSTGAPAYKPVADHITDHGMVLISTETGPFDGMHGRIEQSHYGTPEARDLWYRVEASA